MSLIYQNPDGTWGVQGPPRWDTATMGPNPGSINAPSNPNAPTYSAWLFSHGTNATPEKYKQYMSEFGSGQGPSTPDPGSVSYRRLLETMGYSGDKPPTPEEATQYVNKQYGLGGVPVAGSIDASGNYTAPKVEYPNPVGTAHLMYPEGYFKPGNPGYNQIHSNDSSFTPTPPPQWQKPTGWTSEYGDFPGAPPAPTEGKLGYQDWYNQIGRDWLSRVSSNIHAPEAYLEYLNPVKRELFSGSNQSPTNPVLGQTQQTQQQSNQSLSGSGFQNPYMSLPSYNLNQYPQAFASSGTQNQLDPSGGTGNYAPQNYNRLPNYGFYY